MKSVLTLRILVWNRQYIKTSFYYLQEKSVGWFPHSCHTRYQKFSSDYGL